MYKQIIIVRKDLNMSPGKFAAQVSHASMAFLTGMIRNNCKRIIEEQIGYAYNGYGEPQYYRHPDLDEFAKKARENHKLVFYYKPKDAQNYYGKQIMCDEPTIVKYHTEFDVDKDLYEQWLNDTFTKVVLQAKNKTQLLKAKTMAEDMGMLEGKDFWLIKDNCYTELTPEEIDENGIGRTLTCIGFRPMDSEIIDQISKKYHLYT